MFSHSNDNTLKLKNFLNTCLGENLRDGDVEGFINAIGNTNTIEILANADTDLIIRNFFPDIALNVDQIRFLKQSTIVLRDPCGLYWYPHSNPSNPQRIRYEIRLSFLGLFLLQYYGLTLRVFSTPFENNIGMWHKIDKRFDDRNMGDSLIIQIIPPKIEDLSFVLEMLFSISLTSNHFCLSQFAREYLPQNLDSDFLKFEAIIKKELFGLNDKVALVCNSLVTDLLNDEKMSDGGATQLIENFLAANEDMENILIYISLYVANKANAERIAAQTQDESYQNRPEQKADETVLNRWLCSILSAISEDNPFDSFIKTFLHTVKQDGFFSYKIKCSPNNNILSLISKDVEVIKLLKIIDGKRKQRETKAKLYAELAHCSSETLLKRLFSSTNTTHNHSLFIRKFGAKKEVGLTIEKLQKEFSPPTDSLFCISPATFIHPNLSYHTYKLKWELCSGIIITVPHNGTVPLAAFKRPAYSNQLAQLNHTTSFPHTTGKVLATQGGKASFSIKDFYRALKTIRLRSLGQIPDKSRKQFIQDFFITFRAQQSETILSNTLNLGKLEQNYWRKLISYNEMEILKGYSDTENNISSCFRDLNKLYAKFQEELNIYFENHPDIYNYYLKLFDDIISQAIVENKSLKDVLNSRISTSQEKRNVKWESNLYYSNITLNPHHKAHLTANGYHYYNLPSQFLNGSNEVLLQGLRLKKPGDIVYPASLFTDFSEEEFILDLLHQRHGNIPAIYLNRGDNPQAPNLNGIIDAFKIKKYLQHFYSICLPMITYNEDTFKIDVLNSQQQQEIEDSLDVNIGIILNNNYPKFYVVPKNLVSTMEADSKSENVNNNVVTTNQSATNLVSQSQTTTLDFINCSRDYTLMVNQLQYLPVELAKQIVTSIDPSAHNQPGLINGGYALFFYQDSTLILEYRTTFCFKVKMDGKENTIISHLEKLSQQARTFQALEFLPTLELFHLLLEQVGVHKVDAKFRMDYKINFTYEINSTKPEPSTAFNFGGVISHSSNSMTSINLGTPLSSYTSIPIHTISTFTYYENNMLIAYNNISNTLSYILARKYSGVNTNNYAIEGRYRLYIYRDNNLYEEFYKAFIVHLRLPGDFNFILNNLLMAFNKATHLNQPHLVDSADLRRKLRELPLKKHAVFSLTAEAEVLKLSLSNASELPLVSASELVARNLYSQNTSTIQNNNINQIQARAKRTFSSTTSSTNNNTNQTTSTSITSNKKTRTTSSTPPQANASAPATSSSIILPMSLNPNMFFNNNTNTQNNLIAISSIFAANSNPWSIQTNTTTTNNNSQNNLSLTLQTLMQSLFRR